MPPKPTRQDAELTVDQAFQFALQHHQAGRLAQAAPVYRQIITQQPKHADAIHLLGVIFFQTGQLEPALDLINQAVALQPKIAIYHNNRGQVLQRSGSTDDAVAAYRTAIALDPKYAEPYNNLGTVLVAIGKLGEAIAAYKAALRLNADYAEAHSNLGNASQDGGELQQAVAHHRRAVALRPAFSPLHSNLLLALHYHGGFSASEVAEEHRKWQKRFAVPLQKQHRAHPNARDPDRRLRVGYVSPDLRDHAVARFTAPLLQHHNRARFDIVCYSDAPQSDSVTEQLKSYSCAWREVAALDDARLADLVRDDQIDILIDLAGHTSRGRLLAFARKPAPVQVSYLGYPNTTGLDTIDYRLVDRWSDPEGTTDGYCSEKLWRLPTTGWCYRPPEGLPEPEQSPRLTKGVFTFGSFNTLAKLSFHTIELWAEVLHVAPRAQLILKAKALADDSVCQKIVGRFGRLGIEPHRLVLLPWAETAQDHLAQYHAIDMALDTFPYHGTATTCEALWMGVPVLTLAGNTHHSRVGVSLLHQLGLDRFVAKSPIDFVRVATECVRAPHELATLRSELRSRMRASPLMNELQFTREFEAALHSMWRHWCESPRA